jgi:hypothetical protein
MSDSTIAILGLVIQIALLCVQIPTLIALIVYVVKTWEMASAARKSAEVAEKTVLEMREARDQESAPYVIAYFDIHPGKNLIYLVVKNIGRSMATNVKLHFDPPLLGNDISKQWKDFLTENIIPSMPPNYEIRTILGAFLDYLRPECPICYSVTVSYYGGVSTELRNSQYKLDLSPFRGIAFTQEYDTGDIVKRMEKLVAVQIKVAEATQRLLTVLEKYITQPENQDSRSQAEAITKGDLEEDILNNESPAQ